MPLVDRVAALGRRQWLLLLVCMAVIARLVWCAALASRQPRFDERHYLALAANLAAGKGYVDEAGRPTAYWPVGYPAVLGASYRMFGESPMTGKLLQVLAGIATCLLVSCIGTSAFGLGVGRLAGLLLAIYPTHVFYTTLYLTEPLFTLCLVAAVALMLRGCTRGMAATAAGGVALGLAALVRPVVLLLPVALPLWYRCAGLRWRGVLARTLVTGCCTLLTVSPWLMRNHALTGKWTTIATNAGYVFWGGNNPDALRDDAQSQEINKQLREDSEVDAERGFRLGVRAIAAAPLRIGSLFVRKVSYFFGLETDGALWNLKGLPRPPSLAVTLLPLGVANVAYIFMLSFAILGLLGTPRREPLSSLFLVITGYLVAVAAVFVGDPRYHYGLVPVATIFAAKGWTADWPGLRRAIAANEPLAWQRLWNWSAILSVVLLLMATHLALKAVEFGWLGG
ncbi:MAG: glycosyltransferase family 39 protein [Candidatus Binatia bacterium]